jgi:hypothetical protein
MRAHFLARSGLNLADLVLRLQKKHRAVRGSARELIQITTYANMFIAAFGGDAEQVEGAVGVSISRHQGPRRVDRHLRRPHHAGRRQDQRQLRGVQHRREQTPAWCAAPCKACLFPSAFDPVFEEEDGEGWRRDRATQIDAIMDYIDKDLDRGEQPGRPRRLRLREPEGSLQAQEQRARHGRRS